MGRYGVLAVRVALHDAVTVGEARLDDQIPVQRNMGSPQRFDHLGRTGWNDALDAGLRPRTESRTRQEYSS